MYKIFTKSIFSVFLIIILFTNLMFFANGLHYFGVGLQVDYSNKYFGFSTLYDFFTSGFVGDSGYLVNYQRFLQDYLKTLQTALYGNWKDLFHNPSGSGFIDTLRGIAYTMMSIGAVIMYIPYVLLIVIYGISMVTWIILKFFSIAFGGWYSYLPPNPYDTITGIVI